MEIKAGKGSRERAQQVKSALRKHESPSSDPKNSGKSWATPVASGDPSTKRQRHGLGFPGQAG